MLVDTILEAENMTEDTDIEEKTAACQEADAMQTQDSETRSLLRGGLLQQENRTPGRVSKSDADGRSIMSLKIIIMQ